MASRSLRSRALFFSIFAGALTTGCNAEDSTPSKEDVRASAGKNDSDGLARACEELTGKSECDLCEELDLYDDGICDDFCAEPDPDCPAVEASCEVSGAALEELSQAGRQFMLDSDMVEAADEGDDGFIVSRWGLKSTASHDGRCLAVMSQCFFIEGELIECSPNLLDVIVFGQSAAGFSFERFEDAFNLPARVIAAIGNVTPDFDADGEQLTTLPTDLYYAELEGDSVVDALKTVYAVFPACGFAADISPEREKAAFDPTPGRTWRVDDATFSLRRGNTAEIHDVRATHLDGDFEAYFEGSAGHVAPWGACFIRQLLEDGDFVDVPLP